MIHHEESPADPACVRPLSASEQHLDFLETAYGACHIVRVITFDGGLDAGIFQRALTHLAQRRPIVHTRIVRPEGRTPYFARREEPPEITVVQRRDDEHWHTEFTRQLSTPLSAAGDGLLIVTAIIGDSRGEVVLSCHHAVCDGRSLTAFCRDLAHEYAWLQRGAPGDPSAIAGVVSPPLDDILPPGLTGPSGRQLLQDWSTRLQANLSSPPGLFLEFEQDPDEPRARHLLTYALPPAVADGLIAQARAHGSTVGGAISAAVLRAGLDIGGPQSEDTVGLWTNVDLRPHLREAVPVTNMGLYASSSFGIHAGVRTKPFWTLAREVTEDVRSSLASLEAFGGILFSTSGLKARPESARPKAWPQFMVANLGQIELPQSHEAIRVRGIHGGSPIPGTGAFFFCSAVRLSGVIAIDVIYQTPGTPNQVARAFGESLLRHLTGD